ncbi:MAG: hypothetical protein ACRDIV_12550 [Ktedonobacteraceae bacterium]
MSIKVRFIALIVVPIVLISILLFGIFLNIPHTQASSAISHNPNLNSCNRGLGCDNKNPSQYQSSKGSCTAGSTNEASSSSLGILTLYYNNNCDIWYLQENTNGLEGDISFIIFIHSGRLHFNLNFAGAPPQPPFYSLTLYDGDFQEVVFGSLGVDGTGSNGSAVALAS